MKSKIVFADEELKKSFEKLGTSKTEEKKLHENLVKAFEIMEVRSARRMETHLYSQKERHNYIERYS